MKFPVCTYARTYVIYSNDATSTEMISPNCYDTEGLGCTGGMQKSIAPNLESFK